MKKFILILFVLNYLFTSAQTKDVNKAKDYYAVFVKEGKIADLEKSLEHINTAMQDAKNTSNAEAYFFNGVIHKQYFESKKIEDKSDYILKAVQSFLKTYELNKNFSQKEQLLKLIQIIGYDLYSDGIKLFKESKYEKAYQEYKLLTDAHKVLAENKMDFTMSSASGQTSTISMSDVMNNLAVFCLNSNKKEEAKSIFEQEVKTKPSADAYAKLIQLCNQIADTNSANKYIDEAVKLYPTSEDILIFSINKNIEKGNSKEALNHIATAIKVAPSNKLYLVQSQVLEGNNEFDKAITSYRDGLKLYPNDFDLNYSLAYTLFNSALRELNNQNDKTRPKALALVQEAKALFLKSKSIDATKVDFEKILTQVDQVK